MTNQPRQRIAAICIENNKILLVRDDAVDFFSLPGGSIEQAEDHIEALRRELIEEIACNLTSATYFNTSTLINQRWNVPQEDHNYIVTYAGVPTPDTEVEELRWCTTAEIKAGEIKVAEAFLEQVFPELVKRGMLTK